MSDEKYLYQIITEELGRRTIERTEVPQSIVNNINPNFPIRPYQEKAFQYFINYLYENFEGKPAKKHLLFHMATGSGKTLIMAGLITYLYEKGYRNFLFFVNSTNIIEKTKDNFLNSASSKYLFSETITIGDKRVKIKEVDNFQASNQDDINIVFNTIQALHKRLTTPRENSITYDDFEDQRMVLISDEGHHINADTKKGNQLSAEEREEKESWEGTVFRIFNANRDNILLEFTATASLHIPELAKKYQDKLIFDYPLRQFRSEGYSKEVKVLEADLPQFKRALQGVLLNQFRRKVFEKHKKNIKPVIMFKSKKIKDSLDFLEEFIAGIKNLKPEDLQEIRDSNTETVITKVFSYLDANNISLDNLIIELQEDFSEDKLICVNSKEESEQKQLAVNSLEDNQYRAVFAVDMLNEGWDVLNLFDIVRLYNTRDGKPGKPGKTTMSEAQLIGRGARYCPFQITPDQPMFGRKYDGEPENELRICEELYYHSSYNPRYIQELNTALEQIGILPEKTRQIDMRLKDAFSESDFYQSGLLFVNEQKKYNREDVFGLDKKSIIDQSYKISLSTGYSQTVTVFENATATAPDRVEKDYKLIDFGAGIVRKAINRLEFYRFSNLRKYLPNLKSINEFITSDNYLGKIKLEVSGLSEQVSSLSTAEKLNAAIKVLDSISVSIAADKIEYKGTRDFKAVLLKSKIYNKLINITINEGEDKEYGKSMSNPAETEIHLDLSQRDWFVFEDSYGTSEEKWFIKFVDKAYEKLKQKWDEIYLVRNERHFKLYNFEDGRPLEPDFVLFLIKKEPAEALHYQVFIEPKGGHLLRTDAWKEDFLKSLKDENKLEQLWKGITYIIWGMPFYNEDQRKAEFEEEFSKLTE